MTADAQRRAVAERELALVERVSEWMDRRYLDPILGLVLPGTGDLLSALAGLLGIVVAFRLRAHPVVIARMLLNLALDALVGAVPLLGDVFDIFYRAHTRNLVLLRDREARGARPGDWLVVAAAALAFLAALAIPVVIVVALVRNLG